jgi:hypothetical protein
MVSAGTALALCVSNAEASAAAPDTAQCAQQFDVAQKSNMEAFRNYDKDAFYNLRNDKAAAIFSSGYAFYGRDNIMKALSGHFGNKKAIWSWEEKYRFVDGCKTAFIVYDAHYDSEHSLTSVTFTYSNDKWQVVKDQGTLLPATAQ